MSTAQKGYFRRPVGPVKSRGYDGMPVPQTGIGGKFTPIRGAPVVFRGLAPSGFRKER
jgi:hypothetical protein